MKKEYIYGLSGFAVFAIVALASFFLVQTFVKNSRDDKFNGIDNTDFGKDTSQKDLDANEKNQAELKPDDNNDLSSNGSGAPSSGSQDTASQSNKFNGKYVTGKYPHGWSIEEFVDGDHSNMKNDGMGATGVTAVVIKNPQGQKVIEIDALYGSAGLNACESLYKFEDTPQDYVDQRVSDSLNHGGVNTNVIELAKAEVPEYYVFGNKVRRVSNHMVWDTISDGDFFQSGCGRDEAVVKLKYLTYTVNSNAFREYSVTITDGVSDADLLIMDDILQSLASK